MWAISSPRQVSPDRVRKVADGPQARQKAEMFCGFYFKLLALTSLDKAL